MIKTWKEIRHSILHCMKCAKSVLSFYWKKPIALLNCATTITRHPLIYWILKNAVANHFSSLFLGFSQEVKSRIRQLFYELHPELRTIVIYHPDCSLHIPRSDGSQGNNPWEAPPRIDAILSELRSQFPEWALVYDTNFPPATRRQIQLAHSPRYVNLLNELNNKVRFWCCFYDSVSLPFQIP